MKKALEAATSRLLLFCINTLILFCLRAFISYAIFLRNILCILFKVFSAFTELFASIIAITFSAGFPTRHVIVGIL